MKKQLLCALMGVYGISGAVTWTVTDANFMFSPDTLIITNGDSVMFQLGAFHNATEVSQATWNSNGNTPNGGFVTPNGGGLVLPAQLTLGTHWYVCSIHNLSGMKAVIIVNPPTGVPQTDFIPEFASWPNPCGDELNLRFTLGHSSDVTLLVRDVRGQLISEVSLGALPAGVHEEKMDLRGLPSHGVLFLELRAGSGTLVRKLCRM